MWRDTREKVPLKSLGWCGVDSGQLMVVDPCYVEEGLNYGSVCEASDGEVEQGVKIGTEFGDGAYRVFYGTVEVPCHHDDPTDSGFISKRCMVVELE